jgi:hypothetical protein
LPNGNYINEVTSLSDGVWCLGPRQPPTVAGGNKKIGDSAMSALLNLIYREYCRARVAEMCNRRALMSAELVAAGSKETCGV